jgi:hypothetical protein
MTEPSTTPEQDSTWSNEDYFAAVQDHIDAQDDSPADGAQDDVGDGRAANRREATYRIRAREAEAVSTALMERVTRMQRGDVERQAAAQLHDPSDLWTSGVELVELLDEDGEVDQQRVAEAVAALADSKPYLLKPTPRSRSGFGQGRRTPVDSGSGTSWGEVLRGR